MSQWFIDRPGKLSNVRRTAVGGLLVDATLAKTGVMDYGTAGGGNVRRYNPPAVLEAALSAVTTAPVTHFHPPQMVDIQNYSDLAKGHVVGEARFEDGHIVATLAINDAKLIRAIELGVCRDVSMGYRASHDTTPGVTEDGQSYDEARTMIEWNHIAVVPEGRAGKTVRLMLDSSDIPEDDVELTINGQVVVAAEAQSAFDAYDAGLQAQLVSAVAAKDAAEATIAELNAKVAEVQAALVAAQSEEAVDAAVAARLAAKEAKDAAEAKLARVKAAYPSISLDGRSQDFVDALDLRIELDAKADPNGLEQLRPSAPVVVVDAAPAAPRMTARERMLAANRELANRPIGE